MGLGADSWVLEFHSGIPVYKQIVHLVQTAVAERRLGPGDQLPTIRALHEQLDVNPNTVAKAYRELQHLGVVTVEHGSGCYIAPEPAPTVTKLTPVARKSKILELCARFAAEARSHGISIDELAGYLKRQPRP